jgi:cell wall-associated NlpC family hydrolase
LNLTRTVLIVPVVAAAGFLAAAPSPVAHADPIAQKRAQAERVMMQIHRFDAKLGATIERYNQASTRLASVRKDIKENIQQLKVAKHNLVVAQGQLGELLVAGYKGAGSADAAAYILAAGSFSELLDRVEMIRRSQASQSELLHQIAATKAEIERRQVALKKAETDAKQLVAQRAAQKRHVEAALRQRQQLLASIRGDVRRLIAERERRQAAAAAASAVAASSGSANFGPVPSNGSLGSQAVQIAMQYLGVPYVWGGASPSGFDCSGLTMYVYARLGISLPHYTGDQWNAGPHVSRSDLQPGDLVFFTASLGHMGMYVGGGSFIHAPHTGDVVKISSLGDSWYSSEYQGAVRITG